MKNNTSKELPNLEANETKIGRPTKYTLDLADVICSRLACGESMRSVSRDEAMPALSTLFKWIREDEAFSEQYVKAKEESADALVEEMLDIADNGTNDYMESLGQDGECLGYKLNGEFVQRSKLRVDVRKWAASKLKPKKYGERAQVDNISSDGSMTPKASIDASGLSIETLKEIMAAKDAAK